MLSKKTLGTITQLISILLALLCIIVSIIRMCLYPFIVIIMPSIFVFIIALLLLISELYVFTIFRYFGLFCKIWGKAIIYFIIGALIYMKPGFCMPVSIVLWIFTVIYVVLNFVLPGASLPFFQRKSPPTIGTTNNDYYDTAEVLI